MKPLMAMELAVAKPVMPVIIQIPKIAIVMALPVMEPFVTVKLALMEAVMPVIIKDVGIMIEEKKRRIVIVVPVPTAVVTSIGGASENSNSNK